MDAHAKLRAIGDIYGRVKSAGAAAFVPSNQQHQQHQQQAHPSSSSSAAAGPLAQPPTSRGSAALLSALGHWDAVDALLRGLPGGTDLSGLR